MRGIRPPVVPGCAKEYPIFREIKPPSAHARLPINRAATWHTWSEPFEAFLDQATVELHRLAAPRLSRVDGPTLYNRTYSRSPARWNDPELRQRFMVFARALQATKPGRKIMLLDSLLGPHLNSKGLHALFTLLRGALVSLADDPRAAMYTPLGEVGKGAGAFPLHADLYIAPFLLNVFDNVAARSSGTSTFLSVATLRKLIGAVASLPAARGRGILSLLDNETQEDKFDVFYDLLHGKHRWVRELEQAMEQEQLLIRLARGQGYLLHDRKWLHGRAGTDGTVPVDRVRRLVFGGCVRA